MMLEGKTAVIHGGGGAIGGAVARAFAGAGAHVHLAGRTRARLEAVAGEIGEQPTWRRSTCSTSAPWPRTPTPWRPAAGGIDIALNAVSFPYARARRSPSWPSRRSCSRSTRFLRSQPDHRQGGARHMTAAGRERS